MIQMIHHRYFYRARCLLLGSLFAAGNLWAQTPTAKPPATLKQAFEAVWARQPEAQSLTARRDAAEARKQVAGSWLAEPPSLELSDKTDQFNKNQGSREYVAGLALPLWLPGERSRTGALADAELKATASRALAAQLRIAAALREAWWAWQRTSIEHALAQSRLANAQRLAADVAKRVKAGDLARSDQHQADGAAASAEASLAEASTLLAAATQHLRALIGGTPPTLEAKQLAIGEPMPVVPVEFAQLDATHPAAAELLDRAEVARRSAELAEVQTRANPELTVGTTRERGTFGDAYQQSITVGVRIPFSSESRNRAKVGLARAEAIEAESLLRLERERLMALVEAARTRTDAVKLQLAAAEKRTLLAHESKTFFEKSFRLGESDLPTRLRIELEAFEAERQAARTRIDLAAAVSTLRQTLGLLPE